MINRILRAQPERPSTGKSRRPIEAAILASARSTQFAGTMIAQMIGATKGV
jgi:hypothetical protein